MLPALAILAVNYAGATAVADASDAVAGDTAAQAIERATPAPARAGLFADCAHGCGAAVEKSAKIAGGEVALWKYAQTRRLVLALGDRTWALPDDISTEITCNDDDMCGGLDVDDMTVTRDGEVVWIVLAIESSLRTREDNVHARTPIVAACKLGTGAPRCAAMRPSWWLDADVKIRDGKATFATRDPRDPGREAVSIRW